MSSYLGAKTIPQVIIYMIKHVLGLDSIRDDLSAEIPFGRLTITGSDYLGKKRANINIYNSCLTKGEFTMRLTKLVVELIIRKRSLITSKRVGGGYLKIIWQIQELK